MIYVSLIMVMKQALNLKIKFISYALKNALYS